MLRYEQLVNDAYPYNAELCRNPVNKTVDRLKELNPDIIDLTEHPKKEGQKNKDSYLVYAFVLPNGRGYIGATKQKAYLRWHGGCHYEGNTELQKAIAHYGWHNVEQYVLRNDVSYEYAKRFEHLAAVKYGTMKPDGYNDPKGFRHKPVLQLDKETGAVIRWWWSMTDAAHTLGIDTRHISRAIKKKSRSAGGYRWERAVDSWLPPVLIEETAAEK